MEFFILFYFCFIYVTTLDIYKDGMMPAAGGWNDNRQVYTFEDGNNDGDIQRYPENQQQDDHIRTRRSTERGRFEDFMFPSYTPSGGNSQDEFPRDIHTEYDMDLNKEHRIVSAINSTWRRFKEVYKNLQHQKAKAVKQLLVGEEDSTPKRFPVPINDIFYESSDLLPNGYYFRKHSRVYPHARYQDIIDGKINSMADDDRTNNDVSRRPSSESFWQFLNVRSTDSPNELVYEQNTNKPEQTHIPILPIYQPSIIGAPPSKYDVTKRADFHLDTGEQAEQPSLAIDDRFMPHLYIDLCPTKSGFEVVNMGINDNLETVAILPNTWMWVTRCTDPDQSCPHTRHSSNAVCKQKKSWVQAFARFHDNDPWQWHWIAIDSSCNCGIPNPLFD